MRDQVRDPAVTNDHLFSVLDDQGQVVHPERDPHIPPEDLRRLYAGMVQIRVLDDRLLRLQRQGRLGFYMTSTGEEATHFGVAYGLRDDDWVFPSYREPGVALWRGYALQDFVHQLFGNALDPVKGRQMPVHHSVKSIHYVSISSPVGTQIPQAVGVGMAARNRGKDTVAVAYFGEGTSSTGQFHVGLNFAGVFKAPVLFVCRNNGWAISTNREQQTASKTFAQKAIAYGIKGICVDGNDLLAMVTATRDAAARARRGEGPTLIEAKTYRRGAHSSSDDPSVYRDPDEPKRWEKKDPLMRLCKYMERKKLWTQAWEDGLREQYGAELSECLKRAEATAHKPPLSTMFEEVFAHMTPQLTEQMHELEAHLAKHPLQAGH